MKRFFTIISVALLATIVSCSQSKESKEKKRAAEITFAEAEHDFGAIMQESEATYAFVFKNTGKGDLLINNVQTSCGCTIPEWTREPVEKKKSGVVKVHYNTKVVGNFHKTITVYSNAINSPVTLKIKGTVVPKSEKPEKK
jgi:hypothetical protein